jgi:hypothetical protein
MLKNRFEGSCGTFGEGKTKPIVANDTWSIPPPQPKKKLVFKFLK